MDDDVYTHLLRREHEIGIGELGIPHPSHGNGHARLLGQTAGQDIDLVTGGHGRHDVGVLHAGLFQNPVTGAAALDQQDVELVADPFHPSGVHLDHSDVVAIMGKALAQLKADGAGADDEDAHDGRDLRRGRVGLVSRPKLCWIRMPIHPGQLRCASSGAPTTLLGRAPCWQGASAPSVLTPIGQDTGLAAQL